MSRNLLFILLVLNFSPSLAQKMPESYYQALALIEQNKCEQAISLIDSSVVKTDNNPNLLMLRGEAFLKKHQYAKAIDDFRKAELLKNGIASYQLARAYALINDTENALIELKRHLSQPVKQPEAFILLDTAFINLSKSSQWNSIWLNDWYTPYERMVAEVAYLFSHEQWDDAIDLLNQKIEGRAARHRLYALRGEAYFNIGSYRSAEADFAQAIQKSRRNHEYMFWKAKALAAQGKYKAAIKQLNHAIDLSGGNPHYYMERGQAYAGMGNHHNAITDIQHFLTYYPDCIKAMELFTIYAVALGRNIDALFRLATMIKAKPNEVNYYLLRSKIYISSQNWAVAEKDLSKASGINGRLVEAYMQRGLCYINMGNKEAACKDWKQAQTLGKFEAQELIYKHCR